MYILNIDITLLIVYHRASSTMDRDPILGSQNIKSSGSPLIMYTKFG